jgi:TonB family protein
MNDEGLHFLMELDTAPVRARWHESVLLSVIVHMVVLITILSDPQFFHNLTGAPAGTATPKQEHQITYLTSPPEAFQPKPLVRPPVIPPSDRVAVSKPAAPDLPPLPLPPTPAPPKQQQLAQALPPPNTVLPPGPVPQIKLSDPVTESPKLPVLPQTSAGKTLEDSVRGMARQRAAGGGEVLLDPALNSITPQLPGAIGGAKILSDTMGVDFSAYLQRVLIDIRRNWMAVMPEIARMGKRGQVTLQFEILKDGPVSKIYLVGASGSEPLDRAAIAAIGASNPMPPLPPEFRGPMLRLQVVFLYNMTMDGR